MRATLLASFVTLIASGAHAADTAPIPSADVRAISGSPASQDVSAGHRLDNVLQLLDGLPQTAWAGVPGADAPWVTLRFAGTRYVSRVDVTSGCAGSNRTFGEFSRPSAIVLESKARSQRLVVADRRSVQTFVIDPDDPCRFGI